MLKYFKSKWLDFIDNLKIKLVDLTENRSKTFEWFCITLIAVALYFICGMPVVGTYTIVFSLTLLAATSALVICLNPWALKRILTPIKNEDFQEIISWHFQQVRSSVKEKFFWRCLLAGIALLLIYAPHYRIILFNIDTGQNSISVDLIHFIRLFCFVIVVYLVKQMISNLFTFRWYFQFYDEVKEATAPNEVKEPE